MKTSYNWLNRYVSIPWPPKKLANELTMVGLEVEGISKINDFPETIVITEIISKRHHPNSNNLSLCEVDDNTGEVLQVVCGAANCNPGEKVVLAKIGTKMPEGDIIQKVKIRGEYSYGMLCSERELNLGTDHSGILILPKDTPVGVPLSDYVKPDTIIDWEITPNRPDWLSYIGIAREIAVLSDSTLRLPEIPLKEMDEPPIKAIISVKVQDHTLCPRYTARVIKNVKVGPSPGWIQTALKSMGLRPINNIVDITNFVLLECGQPLHAFDLDKLIGDKITIRRAFDGESLVTLDNQSRPLSSENLVIADEERSVALAGIIGGRDSEITDATTDVLLESAMFDPVNIRKSVKQLGVSTDSSYRFERGVDMEMVKFASDRAAQLICQYAGGHLAQGCVDNCPRPFVPYKIACRYDRVNQLLGVPVQPSMIELTFRSLCLDIITKDETKCVVSVPSFRLDLTREVDLIEEIARFYGLDQIPVGRHFASLGDNSVDAYCPIQTARDQLIALGVQECLTNSLVNEKDAGLQDASISQEMGNTNVQDSVSPRLKSVRIKPDVSANNKNTAITLANPLNSDLSMLRQTLLGGMIQSIAHNVAHGNTDLRLFEIGRVFNRNQYSLVNEYDEVCIALTGRKHPERYSMERNKVFDYYDLRGDLEAWLEMRRCDDYQILASRHPAFEPGICAEIATKKAVLGILGELKREILSHIRIRNPVFAAIINIDRLNECSLELSLFKPLPQFPPTKRDVSFSADDTLQHQVIIDTIKGIGIEFLEKVDLVDIFRDDKLIGKAKKSMAYTLTFRSPERTLSDQEVNQAQEKIRLTLINTLPIEIR